jgi:uncharacterized RDD family membrane protein YckC
MIVVAPVAVTTARYAGLVTRTLAFALDAAIINLVAWGTGIVIALGLSLITLPDDVRTLLVAIGGVLACAWAIAYFVFFWSATGQTPGSRVMRIVVLDAATGLPVHAGRAALRLVCLALSAILLCVGFLMILVDGRRRALHDSLARTVVQHVREEPPAVHHGDVRADA